MKTISFISRRYWHSSWLEITKSRDRLRARYMRLALWSMLMGSLLVVELLSIESVSAYDACAYKVAALLSMLMFLFLADWALAVLLTFIACFLGWHSVMSDGLTAGAAIVVVGISPVVAAAFAVLGDVRSCCECPPDWSSEEDFPRRRCHC